MTDALHPGLADRRPARVEVHLLWMDATPDELARLHALLDPSERERAARFRFPRHARRYVVARAALRSLVGARLGLPPADVTLDATERGRPCLVAPRGELDFNLSHSGELAAIALSDGAPVGVDVEQRSPRRDLDGVARIGLSDAERAVLYDLPPQERADAFLRAWTRKEAVIKALGLGFAFPLGELTVSLAPGEPARVLAIRDAEGPPSAWALRALAVPEGYAGALAVRAAELTWTAEGPPRGIGPPASAR